MKTTSHTQQTDWLSHARQIFINAPISEDKFQEFLTLGRLIKLKKNEIFFGSSEATVIKIVVGVCKLNFFTEDGREGILDFFMDEDWLSDRDGVNLQVNKDFQLQAITEVELIIFSRLKIFDFYAKVQTDILLDIIHGMEQQLSKVHGRIMAFHYGSTTDRLNYFYQHYEKIAPYLSQKSIAAFLGISPEFLSRNKRKSL